MLSQHHDHEGHDHDHDHDNHDNHHHDYEHHDEECAIKSYGAVRSNHHETETEARNINLHAAYLHVLGDLAQSVAVLISGLIIWFQPTWTIIDPIATLLFCAMVFYSTLGVLRSSISVLLEEVPPNVSWKDVYDAIESIEGVENVHDLHIWSISDSIPSLSVHAHSDDPQLAMEQIYRVVKNKGIKHATIQVQSKDQVCVTCAGEGCDFLRLSTRED